MLSIKKICKAHWHPVPFIALASTSPSYPLVTKPPPHSGSARLRVDKPHPSWQSDCHTTYNIQQTTIPSSVQAQHDNTILIEPSNKLRLLLNSTCHMPHPLPRIWVKNTGIEEEGLSAGNTRKLIARFYFLLVWPAAICCVSLYPTTIHMAYMYVCMYVCEIKGNQIMPGAQTSAGVKWLQSKNTLDFLHPYEKRTINIMRFHGISHSARVPLAAPPPSAWWLTYESVYSSVWVCGEYCKCNTLVGDAGPAEQEGGVDGTCNVCGAPRVGLVGAAIQRFCYTQVDTRRVEL